MQAKILICYITNYETTQIHYQIIGMFDKNIF